MKLFSANCLPNFPIETIISLFSIKVINALANAETSATGTRTRVTQHDGFKSREAENSILKTVQDALSVPEKCPKCEAEMRNKEKTLNSWVEV